MSRRWMVGILVAASLGAVSCSDSDGDSQTVRVLVDSKPGASGAAFNHYFPSQLKVRPGDSVEFESSFNGQPHTVTFGTLVDAGLPAFLESPMSPPPPELAKIGPLLQRDRFEAIQGTAQPCFLATGDPTPDACPPAQQKQPEFTGTHTFYNSGFLPDNTRFTVKFAKDVKPGTYQFFCLVHRIMAGKVTVVGDGEPAQSPQEVTRAGTEERDRLMAALQPEATALRSGAIIPPLIPSAPGTVFAGTAMPDPTGAGFPIIGVGEIDEFGPREITVPAGSTVTWPSIGAHTVSFNPTDELQRYIVKEPSGFVKVNPKSFEAAGGPQPPPASGGPRPPPLPVVDGGSWDGTGYRSSGLLFYAVYKLTFTRPGSYGYICLIHPHMQGVVRVT